MSKEKPKPASWDIVYQEKHEEMRSYRDYELNISSWVITFLLAILGVSTTDYFDTWQQKLIISLLAVLFTAAGILSVLYASAKFEAHKTILFEELKIEPKEYRESWEKKKREDYVLIRKFGRPKNLIEYVLLGLLLAIQAFLWLV